MSAQPTSAHPSDLAAQPGADDLCRQVVDELLAIGLDIARLVQKRANEEAACLPTTDAASTTLDYAAAYDRVARALRRTVLLRRHIDKPGVAEQRTAARRQIVRAVENTIHRECTQPGHAQHLRAELLERLDGPDIEDDIAARPVADIIADIRRDLGLAATPGLPPSPRRTPADIAELCAVAARPRQIDIAARPRQIDIAASPRQSEISPQPPQPEIPPKPLPPGLTQSGRAALDHPDLTAIGLCRYLARTEPI